MAKTADRLLEGIKRRCVIPASQPLLGDDDILAMADDVTEVHIVPLLMSLRQDFFVYVPDDNVAITSGTAAYSIPYRAIGRTLRDLKLYDGTSYRDLTLIALEDEHLYQSGSTPHAFYFRGDKIVLVRTPSSSTLELQQWYDLAPSRLVTTSEAAEVVSATTTTVTVTSVPSTIEADTVVDFIQGTSGNSILAMDKTVTNATSTVLTFASGDIPTSLAAGDYISVKQTTPVVQLPNEVTSLLETLTAKRILKALGDFEGAAALEKDEADEMKMVKQLLEPRIQGENTIILNRNSLLRGARTRYRRGSPY